MNKAKLLSIGILLFVLTAASTKKVTTGFQEKLLKSKMNFEMPKEYLETAVIPNNQMNYDFAIKHKEKEFEIRFAIHPLDDRMKNYLDKEKSKKSGEINKNPNELYQASFLAIAMNVSGVFDKIPRTSTYRPESIKAEFNADWGAMAMVETGKEFSTVYKYCLIVAIHKDNIADAYYFYLANDQQTLKELIQPVFHTLKFN
ncbi:hypothetical protein ACYE2N_00205 [Flavobacterium sp. MAHUQ-51]|uniref:hypothetical protein n=1 Tax=Flavobacterium sp. GCM10022190 TaxID=3252639 RepID=UPI00361278C5